MILPHYISTRAVESYDAINTVHQKLHIWLASTSIMQIVSHSFSLCQDANGFNATISIIYESK